MSTVEAKQQKTLFLNGVEVDAIEPTGDSAKDLAAARQFLADKGLDKPSERLPMRLKVRRALHRRFF